MESQAFLTEKSREAMNDKANKLLDHNCITQTGENEWQCRPILGYNITTYTIQKFPDDTYRCNCQGFHKNKYCSHVEAVRIFIARSTPVKERQMTLPYPVCSC